MSSRDDDKREYLRLAMVPSCAVDDAAMTPELLTYLVAFCSYASKRNDGRCWVAQEKVAKRMGVSRIAVSKSARRLAELGYMQVEEVWSEENGKQLTNTYWIDLNMTVPPERDRSKLPRKRAGVGGRKPRELSGTKETPPVTAGVTPPVTAGVTPPVTAGVTPPVTAGVTQNLESEGGKVMRRGKRTRGEACADIPPAKKRWVAEPEPEPDPPSLRGAPPTFGEFASEYRKQSGKGPLTPYSEIRAAYWDTYRMTPEQAAELRAESYA